VSTRVWRAASLVIGLFDRSPEYIRELAQRTVKVHQVRQVPKSRISFPPIHRGAGCTSNLPGDRSEMTTPDQVIARVRSEYARILNDWFADLMELRRQGILEHTWQANRDDEYAGNVERPYDATRRRAA
jgi:hypothetical protein